jgi:hypothetical protein
LKEAQIVIENWRCHYNTKRHTHRWESTAGSRSLAGRRNTVAKPTFQSGHFIGAGLSFIGDQGGDAPKRPKGGKVLQFDCIAKGVYVGEKVQKAQLFVALGIAVIVGGFIFAAAVVGLGLTGIGNLAP